MSTPAPHRIACLAGHGIGPEVTAAASRALDLLSRRHGFRVDEIHPPFEAEALTHGSETLPPATRRATESADAILVTGATETARRALTTLVAPVVRVTRTLDTAGDSTVYAPLSSDGVEPAIRRAAAQRAPLVAVGIDDHWRALVDERASNVRHRTLAEALELLVSGSAGTLVASPEVGDALAGAPRLGGRPRLVATADLPEDGAGLFAPTPAVDHVDGGHGVADPTETLLATALLLSEGLGLVEPARELEASVARALAERRAPSANGTIVRETTREFVDAVLALIPSTRRDTHPAPGVIGMSVTG